MLDVNRLRVLAAVAEHGSVTAAAHDLHLTQPSVSHHLARLEAETGLRLTQRVGRGLRLTPEGALLARRAVEILGRLEAAEDELSAVAGRRTGRVRVAGSESTLSELAAPAAALLAVSHPGIDLAFTDLHPELCLPMLREGEIDAAIVFRYDDAPPSGFHVVHLLDDPMCLLSRARGDTMDDHRDSDWIAGCDLCRRDFLAACERFGFSPRIAFSSDDITVQQALVIAGVGVTTSPSLALRSHHAPGVHATPVPGFRRRVWLATYGEPPPPPATAAFVDALEQVVERFEPTSV